MTNTIARTREERDALVESNLGLVHAYVGRRRLRDLDLVEECIQEGYRGLSVAAEKFDPSRGFCFSTCAWWWIHSHVSAYLRRRKRRRLRYRKHLEGMREHFRAKGKPARPAHTLAQVEAMHRAIGTIKDPTDRLVIARFLDGYNLNEIAKEVGVSKQRIEQRKSNVVAYLRARIQAEGSQ